MVHEIEIRGKKVRPIGFGMMGLTFRQTPLPEETALATLRAAVAAGCNYWNGGEFHGPPDANSLVLLRKYFARYPEDASCVLVNVKGAIRPGIVVDNSRAYIRESITSCASQLGPTGKIDQFECARRDRAVPYGDSVRFIAEMAREGVVGGVAVCEVSARTIREAAASLEGTGCKIEPPKSNLVSGTRRRCGTACSKPPLGQGLLTGHIKSFDDIPAGDMRRHIPRFQPPHLTANLALAMAVGELAKKKGCTPAQLAIGWIVALGRLRKGMPTIIPIPGTSSPERVLENARLIELDESGLKEIDDMLENFTPVGDRYPPQGMELLDEDDDELLVPEG